MIEASPCANGPDQCCIGYASAHNLTRKLHCLVHSSAKLINIISAVVTILQWTSDYVDDMHLFALHSKHWYESEGLDENSYFDYLAIMK